MELYVPKSYVKLYSNTKQSKQTLDIISKYISNNCTITDATAGIGGNSKLFSKYFQNLNCVEIYDYAFKILKQNLNYYNNIKFYCEDYTNIFFKLKQDIIFLDPPWELNYKYYKNTELYLSGIDIKIMIEQLVNFTKFICIKCPLNYEVIFKNWDYTCHYIYKGSKILYKILMLYNLNENLIKYN
jgi:16S rRNA G966 N2-methylase RsmD